MNSEQVATVKAHGLDGNLVEPDWTPLNMAELRALLAGFAELQEPLEIVSASPRPFAAAGVVRTGRGPIFVKRHHASVRDHDGLLEEHRFLAHLSGRGAPVARVLSNTAGESAIAIGEWTYEVHELAVGADLYGHAISWTPFLCAEHARAACEALARLHLAARGFDAPRRKAQPLVASFTIFAAEDPAEEMEKYLSARAVLAARAEVRTCAAEALELLAPFHAELGPLLANLDSLWTHNDLHASNLFWSHASSRCGDSARATAIIDFGLADRTNAVHDIAHAIERNIVEWLALVNDRERPDDVPVHLDHLEALLAGYEAVLPLSRAEAAALAPMTALCHAEFALSEAHYFLDVLHSEASARMAYDGWLVGHARWFHSKRGTALLNAVRRWADERRDLVRR